jgi:hypothetical protein
MNADAAAVSPPASEAQASASPAVAAAQKPPAEQPAASAPPAFTTDVLQSCTARFTRKAWDLYEAYKTDLQKIQTLPVRAQLTARDAAGAEEIHKTLVEAGVTELSRENTVLHFTATFAVIQTIIKHPKSLMLDAIRV